LLSQIIANPQARTLGRTRRNRLLLKNGIKVDGGNASRTPSGNQRGLPREPRFLRSCSKKIGFKSVHVVVVVLEEQSDQRDLVHQVIGRIPLSSHGPKGWPEGVRLRRCSLRTAPLLCCPPLKNSRLIRHLPDDVTIICETVHQSLSQQCNQTALFRRCLHRDRTPQVHYHSGCRIVRGARLEGVRF
jgi:hypothetical protein